MPPIRINDPHCDAMRYDAIVYVLHLPLLLLFIDQILYSIQSDAGDDHDDDDAEWR